MPSFLAEDSLVVEPAGMAPVTVDVAYGGAFYALASAPDLGWRLQEQPVAAIVAAATAITEAVNESTDIRHPDSDDLSFLYGTIITDGATAGPSTNVCVFADAQVDRSPTGSGVQARMATAFTRGEVAVGEERRFRSIIGSEFTGRVTGPATVGESPAATVEVGGRAYYTGEARFSIEEGDDLAGFAVR